MKIDDNNVSGVVFKKSIKNYAETKNTFSAAKYKKCSCFHICACYGKTKHF